MYFTVWAFVKIEKKKKEKKVYTKPILKERQVELKVFSLKPNDAQSSFNCLLPIFDH